MVTTTDKKLYRFYVVTSDGIVLVWTHLSVKEAQTMNKLTSKGFNILQSSTEVIRFGWEEMA